MKLSRKIISRFRKATLLDTVVLVILSLIVFLIMVFGGVVSRMLFNVALQQTEYRAVQAVKSISYMSFFDDRSDILAELERYRLDIKAERIILTDNLGRTYTAPPKIGYGNATAYGLQNTVTSSDFFIVKDRISKLPAITAVGPLISGSGRIMGAAAVSYPLGWVEAVISKYYSNLVFHIFIFITLALVAAIIIARNIKKSIFWMEPYEIAIMFQELSAIVESIKEAVVATDENGRIRMVNQQATEIFGKNLKGRRLQDILPALNIKNTAVSTDEVSNVEVVYNGTELLVNLSPLKTGESNAGTVGTFRKKDEIEQIAKELTQVQEYTNMLRAQTHEFTNKMQVIAGLLEIEEYGELKSYVNQLSQERKETIKQLMACVADNAILSIILGKQTYAAEMKIKLILDKESSLLDIPENISREHLVTILGNLLENAMEASIEGDAEPIVKLFMSDYGRDIIFEVEDSGKGVSDDIKDKIFDRGFSTKNIKGRGMGMYLIKNALTYLKGAILIEKGEELGGALITVIIPKGGHDE